MLVKEYTTTYLRKKLVTELCPQGIRRIYMLETIIVILLILWLVGFFGWGRRGRGRGRARWAGGNLVHILLVIVVILLVLRLLGII